MLRFQVNPDLMIWMLEKKYWVSYVNLILPLFVRDVRFVYCYCFLSSGFRKSCLEYVSPSFYLSSTPSMIVLFLQLLISKFKAIALIKRQKDHSVHGQIIL